MGTDCWYIMFVITFSGDVRFCIIKYVDFPYGYIHYCRYIVFFDIFVQYNLISYLQCLNISFYSTCTCSSSWCCTMYVHSTDV